jgi:hypothetical protein
VLSWTIVSDIVDSDVFPISLNAFSSSDIKSLGGASESFFGSDVTAGAISGAGAGALPNGAGMLVDGIIAGFMATGGGAETIVAVGSTAVALSGFFAIVGGVAMTFSSHVERKCRN